MAEPKLLSVVYPENECLGLTIDKAQSMFPEIDLRNVFDHFDLINIKLTMMDGGVITIYKVS